jgi:hypothetical protein
MLKGLRPEQKAESMSNAVETVGYPKVQELVALMVDFHEYIKNNVEVSAVSLRDV